jgi:hypothetical protein
VVDSRHRHGKETLDDWSNTCPFVERLLAGVPDGRR